MRFDAVARNAQDLDAGALVVAPRVAKGASLASTTRRSVLGVKEDEHEVTALLPQIDELTGIVFPGDGRRCRPCRQEPFATVRALSRATAEAEQKTEKPTTLAHFGTSSSLTSLA